MPDEEKQLKRLGIDGFSLVRAGTETMGSSMLLAKFLLLFPATNHEALYTDQLALSIITYHILSKPALLEKLRNELLTAFPNTADIPPGADLEKLPYLISFQPGLQHRQTNSIAQRSHPRRSAPRLRSRYTPAAYIAE